MSEPVHRQSLAARCPQCAGATRLDPENHWRPFCSERCKLIDLGAWAMERYAVPVDEEDEHTNPAQDGSPQ